MPDHICKVHVKWLLVGSPVFCVVHFSTILLMSLFALDEQPVYYRINTLRSVLSYIH